MLNSLSDLHDKADGIKADTTDIKTDTADIKAMVAEMFKQRPTVVAAVTAQSTPKPIPTRTATGITNIPAPEPHWIHREAITRGIRAMLTSAGGTASLTAAVATAAGGFGKTFAARIYAFEHAKDYPGGRFEIKIESSTMEAQLATLLPLLSPGLTCPPRRPRPSCATCSPSRPPACSSSTTFPAWKCGPRASPPASCPAGSATSCSPPARPR